MFDGLTEQEQQELEQLLAAEELHQRYNARETMYLPGEFGIEKYPRHRLIFEDGAKYRHRCFMGGNGTGKSFGVGGYELMLHLTGDYPTWWNGITYDHPIKIWCCGDTRETVRNIMQLILLGDFAKEGSEALGTGLIPRKCITKVKTVPNTNNSADFALIKHRKGWINHLSFKSYDQGRKAFQGTSVHLILLDEEPPHAIFLECAQRGRGVDGRILMTFTPLSGFTDVVEQFLDWENLNKKGGSVITRHCSWDDVPHLSEGWKAETLAITPGHLRNARKAGIPTAGIGKVYPVEEEHFMINPIPLPAHWRRFWAMDHGWFNTAAAWFAYDKDNDTIYLYADYKRGEIPLEVHATAFKARGAWIPGIGDSAARESDGKQIIDKYKACGVRLQLPTKAVDAGIGEVLSRLSDGRLKVFTTCQKFLEEFRQYRYDEKQRIVKKNDHIMDVVRYGCMDGPRIAICQRHAPPTITEEVRFG